VTEIAIEALEPTDVAQLLRSGRVLLIDVREPKEYEEQRIAGALLYPLSCFDNATLPSGDSPKIVFQCGSGKRSLLAARKRLAAGAHQVAHMSGGLAAWKAAGLPVVSSNPGSGSSVT
jgi:rhodanese-related sulfurtransferase